MTNIGTLIYPDDGLYLPIDSITLRKGEIIFHATITNPALRVYNFGGNMRIDGPDGRPIVNGVVIGPSVLDNRNGLTTTIVVTQPLSWHGVFGVPSPVPYDWEPLDWSKYETLFTEIEGWE